MDHPPTLGVDHGPRPVADVAHLGERPEHLVVVRADVFDPLANRDVQHAEIVHQRVHREMNEHHALAHP